MAILPGRRRSRTPGIAPLWGGATVRGTEGEENTPGERVVSNDGSAKNVACTETPGVVVALAESVTTPGPEEAPCATARGSGGWKTGARGDANQGGDAVCGSSGAGDVDVGPVAHVGVPGGPA